MKQLLIFVCGAPVTGKTTTANTLVDYFTQIGVSVERIGKPPKSNYDQALTTMELAIYKWHNEAKSEVLVVDEPGLTLYDRERLLGDGTMFDDTQAVAIWHNRSHIFMYEHNKDKGHLRWNDRAILTRTNMDQQPIQREGFTVVYHVGGTAYLDLPGFIRTLNNRTKNVYPVPETLADSAESEDAPEAPEDSADDSAGDDKAKAE